MAGQPSGLICRKQLKCGKNDLHPPTVGTQKAQAIQQGSISDRDKKDYSFLQSV
jgi:hypothetical protein